MGKFALTAEQRRINDALRDVRQIRLNLDKNINLLNRIDMELLKGISPRINNDLIDVRELILKTDHILKNWA